ncbi:hypothetical protein SO694_00169034 [Aureococcus anophagefferens]|uniref:Cytosolic carboxypeptidase N-terminal domain-containing protein n=1 Tax=Aureococcus anophagefferens TaxID=44056 RepID=A0ABR1G5L7_AURAN
MKACLLSLVAACALEPPALPRPPTISAAFDSGNVEVVDVACGDGGHEFRLKIRPDAYTRFTDETAHFQWFHFRCVGRPRRAVPLRARERRDARVLWS